MEPDRKKLQADIHALYRAEHAALGIDGTHAMLGRAQQWQLAPILKAGGVLVFPHADVADCGHQTAAVVQACLDSDASDLYGQPQPTWVAAALIQWQSEGRSATGAASLPVRF